MTDTSPDAIADAPKECFVLMPFTDPDGYDKGHFAAVYRDIFDPACRQAGFVPIRADSPLQTSLIHLDILKPILEAPMALCDLTTHNPNVLFELGIRQAFDKPVVLVQEIGTKRTFDTNALRAYDYRKARIYNEVVEDQAKIADFLRATFAASTSGTLVNSIVRLLSLTKAASFDNVPPASQDDRFQLIMTAISDLQDQVRQSTTNYSFAVPTLNFGDAGFLVNSQVTPNFFWSTVGNLAGSRADGDEHLAYVIDWVRQRYPGLTDAQIKIIISRALDRLSFTLENLAARIKAGGVEIRISGPSADDISLVRVGLKIKSPAPTTVTPPP